MYSLVLKKAEEPEIKLPTFTGSQRKQRNSSKTSPSVSLTTLKPLTVWIITNCGKLLKRLEHHSESITRQVDKKSGSPKRRGGSGILKEEEMVTISFPGKSHGQRSLAGYSSWGHKESDMTEVTQHQSQDFSVVNEAEVYAFLETCCFFYDPVNVGNLISGSSAFSKPSLYIWRFLVYILLRPSLKDLSITLLAWEESTIV